MLNGSGFARNIDRNSSLDKLRELATRHLICLVLGSVFLAFDAYLDAFPFQTLSKGFLNRSFILNPILPTTCGRFQPCFLEVGEHAAIVVSRPEPLPRQSTPPPRSFSFWMKSALRFRASAIWSLGISSMIWYEFKSPEGRRITYTAWMTSLSSGSSTMM